MTLFGVALFWAFCWWLLMRWATDADGLARMIHRALGHLLEIGLYKDAPRPLFGALGDLCKAGLKVGRLLLLPSILMLLPILPTLPWLSSLYQYRPVEPGESVVLSVNTAAPQSVKLKLPAGVKLDAPRVASPEEVFWRLRADQPGLYELEVDSEGQNLHRRLRVGIPGSVQTTGQGLRLDYPPRTLWIGDIRVHWLLVLLFWFILNTALVMKVFK